MLNKSLKGGENAARKAACRGSACAGRVLRFQKYKNKTHQNAARAGVKKLTFGLWGSLAAPPSSLPSVFGLPSAPVVPSPDAPEAPSPRRRDDSLI